MDEKYELLAYNIYVWIAPSYGLNLWKDIDNELYYLDICSPGDSVKNCIRQHVSEDFARMVFNIFNVQIKWI